MDYGAERALQLLSEIPNGEYEFHDYIEVDYVSPYHVRIKVKVVVQDGEVTLDFTGTDPQVAAALNLPSFGRPNQWLVLAVVNYLRTSDPTLPLNRGILRSTRVKVPFGSVLNPTPTAATGVRHATGYRVADAVLGALSQAVPHAIPAAGAGQVAIVLFSHIDPATGSYKVSVLQPMQGGSGARPNMDGIDGVNFSAGTLRNVPTEAIELEAPVFVRRYMLTDEAAAGEFRGGTGVVLEFTCLAAEALVTARGMDRFMLRPFGREGGEAGGLGSCLLDPGTERERPNGKIDMLRLQRGDVVRIISPAGGGYGQPLRRDPAKVLADLVDGFLTEQDARTSYAVVIREGKVDEQATAEARSAAADTPEPFGFGPERAAYERLFSPALQDVVARLLADRPAAVRQYARGKLYRFVEEQPAVAGKTKAAMEAAMADELSRVLATGTAALQAMA